MRISKTTSAPISVRPVSTTAPAASPGRIADRNPTTTLFPRTPPMTTSPIATMRPAPNPLGPARAAIGTTAAATPQTIGLDLRPTSVQARAVCIAATAARTEKSAATAIVPKAQAAHAAINHKTPRRAWGPSGFGRYASRPTIVGFAFVLLTSNRRKQAEALRFRQHR
ncbi:unannotated protein [freshwater metagenome]|uniref:Unannotated protein n=1 Tax=freshwater metagenome TaxID=449393 RepID=A0A6J7LFP7_9ZZZZ